MTSDLGDVAVLARQSTNKREQRESIPKQLDCLREFASRIGWPFPQNEQRIYRAIVSGMAPFRPDLDRLKADMASGSVRRVLVYDLSRATRSTLKACELWKSFREHGAKLAIQSFRRILDADSDEDQLMVGVMALFNESHWTNHARIVRDGMHRQARMGRWVAPIPFGFQRDHGILIPEKRAAESLRRQFEAVQKFGYREASRVLAQEGIKVSASTLHYRMQNPAYRGELVYGLTTMEFSRDGEAKLGDPLRRVRAQSRPEDICRRRDAFVAPVPAGAQGVLSADAEARRFNSGGIGTRVNSKDGFLLAGLAYCALCAARFSRFTTARSRADGVIVRYDYVGCRTSQCPNRCLPRAEIEARFVARLKGALREPDTLEDTVRQALWRKRIAAEEQRPILDLQGRELVAAKNRLEEVAAGEILDNPVFVVAYERVCAQLSRIESKLAELDELVRLACGAKRAAAALFAWMSDFSARWESIAFPDRIRLLRGVLFQVRIGAPHQMELVYRKSVLASLPQ